MTRLLVLLLVLFAAAVPVRAQVARSPYTLSLQAGISYSGWNVALLGQYHYRDFSAYLGPSVSLNRGPIGKGPIGLASGLNYHIPSRLDWLGSLVNLDYQLHLFQSPDVRGQRVQEFHVGYGLEFRVSPAFSLVQQIGYGGWLSSNATAEGRKSISGYTGLVRLKAGYRF